MRVDLYTSIYGNSFLSLNSVDCKLGEWEEWEDCSVTCGEGKMTRTREEEISASGGGKKCKSKNKKQTKNCSMEPCPGQLYFILPVLCSSNFKIGFFGLESKMLSVFFLQTHEHETNRIKTQKRPSYKKLLLLFFDL
jgi:hypothetical protein